MRYSAMLLALIACLPALARAEFIDVRVVNVTSATSIQVSSGTSRQIIVLPQLTSPKGCRAAWATKWAQDMLPPGTALKWLPDKVDPRLYFEVAGRPVEYSRAAISSGAAVAFTDSTQLRDELTEYETMFSDVRKSGNTSCTAGDIFEKVALQKNIARRLLYAVALTESGRAGAPHPWTLNVEGKAFFYKTRDEAHRALINFLQRGYRSIDVGPMQVNLQFHGKRFADTWTALDPYTNIAVGADILRENMLRDNDSVKAVARYHSSTPWRGQAYVQRVSNNLRSAQSSATFKP